jgi:hypothetical protein
VVRDVLEPDVLRGTRPVLRGGSRSNAASLPDGEPKSQPVACSRTVTIFNRRLPARQSRKGL